MRSICGVCVLAVTATVAGCGGGGYSPSPSSPSSPSSTPATSAITITITSQNGVQSFSPNPASAGGQMVVFKNSDSVAHRVVLNDGSLDTGTIAPGATSAGALMPTAGTNYHCSLHAGMVGAIAGTSGNPPACEGPYCGGYY